MEILLLIIGLAMSVAIGVRLGISPLVEKPFRTEENDIIKLRDIGVFSKDEYRKLEKQYYWIRSQGERLIRMKAVLQELNELGLLNDAELEEKLAFLDQHYSN